MAKTVCFTGHRVIPPGHLPALTRRIDRMLCRLYDAGFRTFITGGADGFDTVVALRIVEFRKTRPDARLTVAIPYRRNGDASYRRVLECADEVVVAANGYNKGAPLERDRYMVDRSDVCVAYYLGGAGGTYYTARYANVRGVPVYNLAAKD